MYESEDGTLTGSINVSQLGNVKPKTDEAKAQLEALKASLQPLDAPVVETIDDEPKAEPADEAPDKAADQDEPDEEDLDALRGQAEAAGVKVDGRWGAERLHEEIASVTATTKKGKG